MKTLIVLILLVFLGVGALMYSGKGADVTETGTPVATTTPTLSYTNDAYGISFEYPETYELTEVERGNGERRLYVVTLMRKADLPPPINGEGPPSIEVAFYQNNLDGYTPLGWITGDSRSNFKLSDDTYASTTVAGREAVTYRWSGLYEGVTTVFIHRDSVVAMSGTYLSPGDEIRAVYQNVLDSTNLR